ncbi:hypothetical protein GKG47_15200 [Lactonifactor sp. BIOML-A3]|uniref:hypothetical protein n=1 Tax=Lactonifactor TaxID=420345 RepID=UPI0012B05054|nr:MULTISPECIES: hypothetical protein [Lactonifactor]MSB70101.1 hypothetical protein [Lactonifactor sp. BIOML-A7]MCB5713952.1 hypothetical protein [Lactonifactor longoviformis]MCB5717975.1 hypothetical protein [Lactonifactor longoviformis]MSA02795.1 hypothetical protein [Lactonifactor sp. BIOML-A5]MSA09111.1 hypothetical protein [Lactonifactor sp. BIOML-A4]
MAPVISIFLTDSGYVRLKDTAALSSMTGMVKLPDAEALRDAEPVGAKNEYNSLRDPFILGVICIKLSASGVAKKIKSMRYKYPGSNIILVSIKDICLPSWNRVIMDRSVLEDGLDWTPYCA